MLTTNITLAEKYDYLSDKFKKAFTFLRETDLASLPTGRAEIDGDEVYASDNASVAVIIAANTLLFFILFPPVCSFCFNFP